MTRLCSLAAVSVFAFTLTARADQVIYDINRTVGAGTVIGTITTDGTIGTLATADIVDWNLTLTNGFGTTLDLTGPSVVTPIEGVEVMGSDLTASATSLSFNFNASDGGFFLIQQGGLFNGGTYYCDGATGQANCTPGGESDFPGVFESANQQFVSYATDVTLGAVATSTGSSVPEPSSVLLLSTGVLGLAFLTRRRMSRDSGRAVRTNG